MSDPIPDLSQEPPNLRLLRMLVTALLAVMILGFIVLIGLFVMRFQTTSTPNLPTEITLPAGVKAVSYTQTENWVAVVGNDNIIRIFDPSGGTLLQEIPVLAD